MGDQETCSTLFYSHAHCTLYKAQTKELILNNNSENNAHGWSDLHSVICLRHFYVDREQSHFFPQNTNFLAYAHEPWKIPCNISTMVQTKTHKRIILIILQFLYAQNSWQHIGSHIIYLCSFLFFKRARIIRIISVLTEFNFLKPSIEQFLVYISYCMFKKSCPFL